MAKIYLDAGHGGTDPGATGNGLREKDLTLKIAKYTRDHLQANYDNASIRMSRTNDKTLSLSQRTKDANKWGADVFVSIHINAFNKKASGYEDFIHTRTQASTPKLQNAIHAEVSKVFSRYPNRGKKRANFHVLRESKMPAVLTECLFIDNPQDARFLKSDSNLKKIGEAHAKGIAKHLKLKKKATPKPRPSTNNSSGGLYYVQIGAFSKKANADALVKQAKREGYKDAYAKLEGGLYKVQLGAFSNKKNADNLAAQVKKDGFNVYVAR